MIARRDGLLEAYVHVQALKGKVGVGLVIREKYETLASSGWLHGDGDMWQALRDTVLGLCEGGQPMTIYTPLQAAELAVRGNGPNAWRWADVRAALESAGSSLRWCGHVPSTTGMADAQARSNLMLGRESRGTHTMSWNRNGRCR